MFTVLSLPKASELGWDPKKRISAKHVLGKNLTEESTGSHTSGRRCACPGPEQARLGTSRVRLDC